MKKILPVSLLLIFCFFTLRSQVAVTVNTPGTFYSSLSNAGGSKLTTTDLTVSGKIDARDIKFMRDSMPVLAHINLEDVLIEAYSGSGGTDQFETNYPANTMPVGSFHLNSYNTVLKSIILPNSITSIGAYAFFNCSGLTGSLIIPNFVTSIGLNAFAGCSGLTGTLTIPNSVTSIASGAFTSCSGFTGSLILPSSLTTIEAAAFWGCSGLNGSLSIPATVTSIGEHAFHDCSKLSGNLVIPNSVTNIGERAFMNCSGFKGNLVLSNTITKIELGTFQNCNGFTGDLILPNSITSISMSAFDGCSGFNGNLVLSNNLTSIDLSVFNGCSGLSGSLTIPGSVKSIGSQAFAGCSGLNGNLNLHEKIETIDDNAFSGCSFTGNLNIPDNLTTINIRVFYNCNFTGTLVIPEKVTSIGDGAFYSCNFTDTLIIPKSVKSIGAGAFFDCSGLTHLDLGNSVKTIGGSAFYDCTGLTGDLTTPSSITSISAYSFYRCLALNGKLKLSGAVNSIGNYAFGNCPFTGDLKIPASVTSIGTSSFSNCTFNGNIYLPGSIASIAAAAFEGCSGIQKVYTGRKTPLAISANTFQSVNKTTCELIVPKGSKTDYQAADYWKDFVNITEAYFIHFNSQGGTGLPDTATISNSIIGEPLVPTKTGYSFAGWYKEASCVNAWNFATDIVSKDTTLFAKWNINSYTVSFNSNGGSLVSNVTAEYNTSISEPANPSRTGYSFSGWYSDADLNYFWSFGSDKVVDNTTLFAKWTPNTYIISFNSNGGSTLSNKYVNYDSKISPFSAPAKTGYTFVGWFKESALTNEWIFATDVVTGNATLYAKWNINNYAITFNSQGGSSVPSTDADYNTKITSPADPLRTGYTFAGWHKEPACTNVWNFTGDVITAETTLYAKWNINSYTVNFNSKGGSTISILTADYNSVINSPVSPTLTGYTFAGWYKEDGCTNSWNFATDVITKDTTLFAKWTLNSYTVVFDSKGGSAVNDVVANYNTTIAEPVAPAKLECVFDGWYKENTFTNKWNFAADVVTENNTLYAKWIVNTYTATFNSQGGSSVNNVTSDYNTIINEPQAPSKTGYTFVAWYQEPECANIWNFSTNKITTNITLYAKWTINNYTVTFDSKGGSAVSSINADYNTMIPQPSNPAKTGYTFTGWYKEAECTNAWNFDTDAVTGNTTLYGKWAINSYSVTFNSQGGSSVSLIKADYNSVITEPSWPTKADYTFDGWYKDAACTNAWIFASDVITKDTTLYAKWIIQVSFDPQGGSSISPKVAEYNSTITSPADPTRTGYTFNGWYKESECTNKWNFGSDVVTGSTTLYAKWTINSYVVTFDSKGGTAVSAINADYNSTLTEPAQPTKTDYLFNGWYKESECTNEWNFASDIITENITLYAKWTKLTSVDSGLQGELSIYPNPFYNNITVKGENIKEIVLLSQSGSIIEVITSEKTDNIDVSKLQAGIYLVQVKAENGSKIFKMIKK